MSIRNLDKLPPWQSAWWEPHAASANEWRIPFTGTPAWHGDQHAFNEALWARFVPPNLSLFESLRRGLGERLDERWLVERCAGYVVVKRADYPTWQFLVQETKAAGYLDDDLSRPYPFAISSGGGSCCPYSPAIRIDHPIGMLNSRLGRDIIRTVTAAGGNYRYNNRAFSFRVPAEPFPHNLYVHISTRSAFGRRCEGATQPPRPPDLGATSASHLLAMRAAWAIWLLIDLAQRHPNAPKPRPPSADDDE